MRIASSNTRTPRSCFRASFLQKRFVAFAVKMSGNALVEAGSNEDVVEEVCSTTEEFEADRAYTSNDLCVTGRNVRLERDVAELQGDGALDRAYLRGLASLV